MERLCDLYFELSNKERLKLLFNLREKNMNITELSHKIDTTTQECSRHVSRLTDFNLTLKNADRTYSITPYGNLTLRLILGHKFASNNQQYFNTHTLDDLPSRIVSRIHELDHSRFIQDVWLTFSLLEKLFKEAEEYIWMIHDQYYLSILPLGVEALKRGVKFKSIDPMSREENRRLDPLRPDYLNAEDEKYILESWKNGNLEVRLTENIGVFLYVSEKNAIVAFPLIDGSFDYLGFVTNHSRGMRLCQDIFEYYWSLGIHPTQEKMLESHKNRMLIQKLSQEKESS
jgi:predicted transcriptional regulator